MKFVEHVPDYILRNYLKVGQLVTILQGSSIRAQVPGKAKWETVAADDLKVEIVNFLPGYTEAVVKNHEAVIHNHEVVWKRVTTTTDDIYFSTDINNVKEVQDAP